MQVNKCVDLPSGAKLEITVAPFTVSKALYQAILDEGLSLRLDPKAEIDVNLYKDLFCKMFSSKKVEATLNECMKRCTYNALKITDDTWEPVEARKDYLEACFEVAKENVGPFTKSLYAKYEHILSALVSAQA